jgi:hypothetical protein
MRGKIARLMVLAFVALLLIPLITYFNNPIAATNGETVMSVPSSSFFSQMINDSSSNVNSGTSFFAPFELNLSNFSVTGRFVSFHYYMNVMGPYAIVLSNFTVWSNSTNYTLMYETLVVQNSIPQSFRAGIMGSVFYAYSSSIIVLVHDSPTGLLQVYSSINGTTVSSVLPVGLYPSRSLEIQTVKGLQSSSRETITLVFNNSQMEGYMVSSGSNFTETALQGGSYSVTKEIAPDTFFNTFTVPRGADPSSSALSIASDGLKYNTLTYLAEIYWNAEARYSMYDASFYSNTFTVSNLSIRRGNIFMLAHSSALRPEVLLLIFNRAIFSTLDLLMKINGKNIGSYEPLPLLLENPYWNITAGNVTEVGNYVVVGVYSPVPVYSLLISQKKYTFNPSAIVIPAVIAAAVTVAAAGTLYARKRRES